MTICSLERLNHTGFVVADIASAMRELGEVFGCHWLDPWDAVGEVFVPGGSANRVTRATWSLEGPHHIELIELIDDTAHRRLTGGSAVHHIGFAVDDVRAESARLESLGFPRELSDIDKDGGNSRWAYHHNPHGLYIEVFAADQAALMMGRIEDARRELA